MRWVAYFITALISTQTVSATPITIGCTLLDSTTTGTRFIEADQFVYDLEAQSVDMRSAKTVGTTEMVNWLYVTRKDIVFDDTFSLKGGADWFAAAGIYGGTPTAMRLSPDGALTMTYIEGRGAAQMLRWKCTP